MGRSSIGRRTSLRLAPAAAVVACLLWAASAAAVEPTDCTLEVDPPKGEPGTVFTLSGAGYTPTHLDLVKEGGSLTTVALELGDADPFEIPIGSREGDQGRWTATAYVEGTSCRASATFRVVLPDTAGPLDLLAPSPADSPPLLLYLSIVVVGFASGTLVARRLAR
jgi:hypothetical protein